MDWRILTDLCVLCSICECDILSLILKKSILTFKECFETAEMQLWSREKKKENEKEIQSEFVMQSQRQMMMKMMK